MYDTVERRLSGVSYTAEWRLGGVSYTAEWWLSGVTYTTELQLGGLRYTGKAFANQMKSTTALNGTILQKTDQNFKLLSYNMMNMKFFKVCFF